jgi:diguanylate cyclase (GGDEF)-like protein/PAS domain S-box-containing protein
MKILIVDDHPVNRKLLRVQLEAAGHGVSEAADGVEALAVLGRENVDGVVSDILMPNMDGFRLCLEIRKRKVFARLPFVFYTSTYKSPQDRDLALSVGADEYLTKPSPIGTILDAVGAATQNTADRIVVPAATEDESYVLKQYSEALVRKLEERNLEFEEAIGKLQTANDRIRESEERFRQMAENIRDVFFLTSTDDSRTYYVSPAYERIWGRSGESLIADPKSWFESVHPDDRARIAGYESDSADTGRFSYEYRIVRPDGEVRWIRARGYPVTDENGRVYRTAGVAEDITEHKRTADALRESERRFSSMLGHVEMISIMLDTNARITYCNDYFLGLVQQHRDDVIGRNWFELFIPRGSEDVKRIFAQLIADMPGAWHQENEILTRSGERRLIRWHNTVLRSGAGNVIGTASLGEDITESRKAEDSIRRLNRVYAVLSGINTLIVRVKDKKALFDGACRIAVEEGGFGMAWIGEFDPVTEVATPVACAGDQAEGYLADYKPSARADLRSGRGGMGQALRSLQPFVMNDLAADLDGGAGRRRKAYALGYRSFVVLPLVVEGRAAGTLALFARESGFFDAHELKLLEELAGDISFALLTLANERKVEKLSRIRAVSSEINAAIVRIDDAEALLRDVSRIVQEHGKFELSWIGRIDPAGESVRTVASSGFTAEAADGITWARINSARGTMGEAIQKRTTVVRNDMGTELPVGLLRQEAFKQGFLSTVCLPLIVDEAVAGLIALFAAGRQFFDEDELALLNEVASDVSFALQSMARREKLNYLAFYDSLTGLPNRALLLERLGRQLQAARQSGSRVALILADVKRFRFVNESFGQHAGDALLREIAARAKKMWPESESLSRIAADAFAGTLSGPGDETEIAHALENAFTGIVGAPFVTDGKDIRISMTAGIGMFPADGDDADTLYRNAEAALKRAKESGEPYLFYQPQMNARVAETLLLESKMRGALDKEQFVLHYQPKVNLATGAISGFEALIRWNDPETGLVPPVQFIPLLEETGMIIGVGRWAIRKALEVHGQWLEQGLRPPPIAVNLSPIQLRQKDFVESVRDALGAYAGKDHGLDLEITESLLMEDIEGNIAKLKAIKSMGVNIAIDDFGTGYSSLRYLAKLPIDTLKIDRSFIITMTETSDSMTIVSTIISLAHSLSLKVVAEGVDAEEQRKMLGLLKCDELQGYLFSKPLPEKEAAALLRDARQRPKSP